MSRFRESVTTHSFTSNNKNHDHENTYHTPSNPYRNPINGAV